MRTHALQFLLIALLGAQAAEAADGVLDYAAPSGWAKEVTGTDPHTEKYTSADGRSVLAITSIDNPHHVLLERKGAMEGFAEASAKLGMRVTSVDDQVFNAIPMMSFHAENDDKTLVMVENASFKEVGGKMFTLTFCHAGKADGHTLDAWHAFLASVVAPGRISPHTSLFLEGISGEAGCPVGKFAGFQHGIPGGWFSGRPDRAKTKAILAPIARIHSGIIKVDVADVARSLSDRLDVLLFSFAGDTLNIVQYEYAKLDGVDCVVGRTDAKTMDQPQMVLAAVTKGQLYLLMACAIESIDVQVPMKTIMDSWKWGD